MPNIHVGQTALRLEFRIGVNLSGASKTEIRYYKPNGVFGVFDANIADEANGVVYYDVESEGDIDDTGKWRFWVHVYYNDGTELDSNVIEIDIYEPGKRYISHPYGYTSLDGGILMSIQAFRVIYNNNLSRLNADDVQAAIDEVKHLIDTLSSSNISYNNSISGLNAVNVKSAIDELKAIIDNLAATLGANFKNVLYVAKNGSDTPPAPGVQLGTIDNPFLTIQAAISSINNESQNNHYTIVVKPGVYQETLSLRPYINIVGLSKNNTIISNNGIHTIWFAEGGSSIIQGVSFGGDTFVATHPNNAPGSSSIEISDVSMGAMEINFLGAGVDKIKLRNNVEITNSCIIHSALVSVFDTTISGDLVIDSLNSQHPHSSLYDTFGYIKDCDLNSVHINGNSYIEYNGNRIKSSIIVNGSSATIKMDALSYNGNVTTQNGASLNLTTRASGIAYNNTISGLAAKDVQSAIDELRSLI